MVLTATTAGLVLAAVFVGVTLQRVSGTGAGLVIAPMLALLLGPAVGVLLTNITTTVTTILLTIAMRRHIQWRSALVVMAACVPGAFLGGWAVGAMSAAWLQVVVGAAVLGAVALIVVAAGLGRLPHYDRPWLWPASGFLGGALNTVAGVGAPPMVILARLTRWGQDHFAATVQPIFMAMGLSSVVAKLTLGSVEADLPPLWLLPAVVGAMLLGIWVGVVLSRRVSSVIAGEIALALAGLGGAAALVQGVLKLT